MRRATRSNHQSFTGFTLIEVMVTVAIVGILAAIALPSYSEYVMRSRLMDAHSKLGDLRGQMERYFMDNRTFASGAVCGIEDPAILMITTYNTDGGRSFDLSCAATATTYTITASGIASKGMSGFVFDVTQANAKTSVGPSPWPTTPVNCWFVRKNGDCS